uniref:Ubiquitin hydrolase n=1 Tax=Tanacetum cinerariifolium TaxID=118510 RepID=A0A6L2L2A9_TANCI|nr:ubiquitin hydrolase [Tanacetum cinerariifolium]
MAKSKNEVYDDSHCSKSCRKNTEDLNTKISKLNEALSDSETNLCHYKLGLSQVEDRLREFKTQEIKFCERIRGLEFDARIQCCSPSLAQVYSPLKKDMSWTGLPELADDTITDYSRHSPSIESNTSEFQNSNSSISEHGESSESILSKPMIKFVKAAKCAEVKTNKVKAARKPAIKYADMYRNTSKSPKVRGDQRNWNNLKTQQLGKDFVMKNKACFKCGHFDHLAYDCVVWAKKGKTWPKNNYTDKSMSPRTVFHKNGRTPTVNRTNMNVAQPKRTSFAKTTHSYVRRPFHGRSAVRTQSQVPRVSTVTKRFLTVDSKFSTAKSTFSTDLGDMGKAVKALACSRSNSKGTTYRAAKIRMRALLLSTFRRTGIPKADMPPQKRACLTTLAPGFKVGESSTAGAARQSGPALEFDRRRYRFDQTGYGITDTWTEIVDTLMEIALTTFEGVNQRVTELDTTVRQRTDKFEALGRARPSCASSYHTSNSSVLCLIVVSSSVTLWLTTAKVSDSRAGPGCLAAPAAKLSSTSNLRAGVVRQALIRGGISASGMSVLREVDRSSDGVSVAACRSVSRAGPDCLVAPAAELFLTSNPGARVVRQALFQGGKSASGMSVLREVDGSKSLLRSFDRKKNNKSSSEFALIAKSKNEVYDDSHYSKSCRKNTEDLNMKISKLNEALSDSETNLCHYKLGLSQVEARLVEFKTQEIKFCEKIRGLEFNVKNKNIIIENLMNELEQIKKEKEGLDSKLTGFESAPKDPDTLLESQRSDKNKEGLHEFADDTITDYSMPFPSKESNTSDLQNSNSSISEHGESLESILSKPMIKFVKAAECAEVKTKKVKAVRKPAIKYAEMYRNTSKSPKVKVFHKTDRTPTVNSTNMNVAQPKRTSFAKTAHSYVRKPFHGRSAVRTQSQVPRVSTVTKRFPTVDSKFSTAKSTFSTDLGNKGKAVKASACWIWRPKQNTTEKCPNCNSVSVIFKKFQYIDTQGRLKSLMAWVPKKIKKEKEGLDSKLIGFESAPKDLDTLLESQRSDKNKDGLGYSAIPPPAQVYSPLKKDMSWTGLPKFADDTITDYSRPSPSIETSECAEVKTNKVKAARKPAIKYAAITPTVKSTNMNVAQPKRTSFAKTAHSYVRKPFHGRSTVKTQSQVPRVFTVTKRFPTVDSKFSTAKSTFSTDLGNKGKAVKASACSRSNSKGTTNRAAGIRMRALLLSTSRRTDIPKADMPPRKRACLTTPANGFKVEESSAAGAMRQSGPALEFDRRRYRFDQTCYGITDTWNEIVDTSMKIAQTTLERVNQRVTELDSTVRQRTDLFKVRFDEAQDDRALLSL